MRGRSAARAARVRLLTCSAACLSAGLVAIPLAWRNPDSDLRTALWTLSAGPWALGAVEGALAWRRGRASRAVGLEHALAVYAAGTGGFTALAAAGWAVAGRRLALPDTIPCGPLDPICEPLAIMALACVMAVSTAGLVFPALLPPAFAALSAALLRGRAPSATWLAVASCCVALGWAAAAITGVALAHA